MYSVSSTPRMPASEPSNTLRRAAIFSRLEPRRSITGCRRSMAESLMPLARSSAITPSRPILSNLSIATVISTILSASPITSAMPARILRLFILITTLMPRRRKTSSMIWMSSTSQSSESLPTTSASHWKNSRYRPRCGRSARQTGCIW